MNGHTHILLTVYHIKDPTTHTIFVIAVLITHVDDFTLAGTQECIDEVHRVEKTYVLNRDVCMLSRFRCAEHTCMHMTCCLAFLGVAVDGGGEEGGAGTGTVAVAEAAPSSALMFGP